MFKDDFFLLFSLKKSGQCPILIIFLRENDNLNSQKHYAHIAAKKEPRSRFIQAWSQSKGNQNPRFMIFVMPRHFEAIDAGISYQILH